MIYISFLHFNQLQATIQVALLVLNNALGSSWCTSTQTRELWDKYEFNPPLLQIIQTGNAANKLQAMWILDNVARDLGHCRDSIVKDERISVLTKVNCHQLFCRY